MFSEFSLVIKAIEIYYSSSLRENVRALESIIIPTKLIILKTPKIGEHNLLKMGTVSTY